MRTYTALIVPALSNQAGQCRIVAREGKFSNALKDYRAAPSGWSEVGLMNSRGKLVCCEPLGDLAQQLQDCEPLMAGLVLSFEVPEEPAAAAA